jgi:hypothetical protein
MPAFALQFDPGEIPGLAERFGDTDDRLPEQAGRAAAARGFYARDEFLTVCAWKSPRSRPRVQANDAATIEAHTREALAAPEEAARMEALLRLGGVGVPTASTLLYFADPASYTILDVRALESLGVRGRSTYPIGFWLEYLYACRELARAHGVSLRTLDKALWQHSKERAAS